MIIELLADTTADVATEILERTSSTERVQQIVQLSMAPAFLLAGIGAIMNVMMGRLTWIAGRVERLAKRVTDGEDSDCTAELEELRQRRRYAQRAVMLSTGSATLIALVIALLFLSVLVGARMGNAIAVVWVLAMVLLVTALVSFFRETLVAVRRRAQTAREER